MDLLRYIDKDPFQLFIYQSITVWYGSLSNVHIFCGTYKIFDNSRKPKSLPRSRRRANLFARSCRPAEWLRRLTSFVRRSNRTTESLALRSVHYVGNSQRMRRHRFPTNRRCYGIRRYIRLSVRFGSVRFQVRPVPVPPVLVPRPVLPVPVLPVPVKSK